MKILSAAVAALLIVFDAGSAPAAPGQDAAALKDVNSSELQEADAAMTRKDYAAAMAIVKPLAEHGNAGAQWVLGTIYRDGLGVPQDETQAFSLIRKAADQGLVPAQRTLGTLYYKGQGVAQDYAQALTWFRKAADQGDAKAWADLGLLYQDGHGVPVDYAQALAWFQKAADRGVALGELQLGAMYMDGKGVTRDYAQALGWLHKAADQGDAFAQNDLGLMYQNGRGVPQDDAQAIDWFRKSADQGNVHGEDNLGWMYHLGRGVKQDDAEALQWLRRAALLDPFAQNNLGTLYRDGKGVPKDEKQAVELFRKAADQGNAQAQINLGQMYHDGKGVPQDYAAAVQWFAKAAAQNNANAETLLGLSYQKGDGVSKDSGKAIGWYQKAAAQGDRTARANLASMYTLGDGVPKDAAKAAEAMGSHPFLTSGATILKDDIVYTVAADATYTMEESVMVRVNVAQAVQRWGQAYLPFSSSLEDIKVIEAYTIDKGGKRIDVTPDKILIQQSPISSAAPSFGDVQIKAIVFSSVEPGAVTAYHIIKTVKKPLFAGQFSMAEYFPTDWEIKESSVTLVAPTSLPLKVQAIGMQGGAVTASKAGTNEWVWTLHDASQALAESGSIDSRDFGPRVAATSFADYSAAAKAYLDGAESKAKVTADVRKLADQITRGITDPHAKAVAIYNWVSHNIRYVSVSFGLGGVVPHDADAILAARYGDCKDHVVLLQALLAAKGIASSPVLVNAISVYWQPDVAISPGVFDHCITYIPQFNVFVDSTAEVAPFGVLPPTEAGKPALVMRAGDGKPQLLRLPLTDATRDTTRTTMVATMADDGSVTGKTVNADTGIFELLDRLIAANVPAGQETMVAGGLLAQFGAPGTGTMSFGDARNLDKPYIYSTSFTLAGYVNVPGPGAFTFPVGVPGMGGIVGFPRGTVLPVRKQAIACQAEKRVEDSRLNLPASIKIKQLPSAVHAANEAGRYDSVYTQSGQSVSVHRELLLTPKAALCDPDDYQQMRALGAAIARDMRAQVIY